MKKDDGGLSLRTKLGFGVGDLGGNIFFTVMGFYTINYLTDVVMVSAGLAAAIYWIGKAWDAVTDPMMGYISDRTKSRWGRRRPWLLIGSVPLLLAMWAFFSAPSFAPAARVATAAWAMIVLCLLNTAYTVVNIPYGALTPDLARTYEERTTLNGYRFSFAVLGTIVGAVAVQALVGLTGKDVRAGYSLAGAVLGAVMCATTLVTFFSVRERPRQADAPAPEGFLASYAGVFKDRPYVILLFTYTLNIVGFTFLQAIIVYYFKYVLSEEGLTAYALLALLGTAAVFVPVSMAVIKRIGKKRCYQLAFLVISAAAMLIFLFGHSLGPVFTITVMAFAGVGFGFGYAPPFAMLPDAIEVEARRSGKSREGAYYGMWTFMAKFGSAFAGGCLALILGLAGFKSNEAQGPATILAMRGILGPVSAFFLILAALLVQRYPLDKPRLVKDPE